jgi:GAF domain-containing protein
MEREALLLSTFVGLADHLVAEFDVVEMLTLLSDRCVEALEVSAAGIMLASPAGELRVIASSSETMRILELLEQQASEGPCQDCYRTGTAVIGVNLADTDTGSRWPRFAPRALDAGFRSVYALPMHLRERTVGALNLFHTGEAAMPEPDVVAAQALADVATIAILQHHATVAGHVVSEQLQHALNSRVTIEQAKGVLHARTGIDMDDAFNQLRRYARNHNRKLVDVAHDVISDTLHPASLSSRR